VAVDQPAEPARSAERANAAKILKRAISVLALAAILEYVVVPQLPGIQSSLENIGSANLWFILAAILLEAGSLLAYAALTRSVLPNETVPSLWTTFRIDLPTFAISHIVPGGGAAGSGLGFRLLTAQGVEGSDTGFALATQGIGSAVVLNAILWVALVISIPVSGYNPLYLTAAIAGAVILGAAVGCVLLLTRGEARAARFMRWVARKVPFLNEDRMHRLAHRLSSRLRAMGREPGRLSRAFLWAAANWLLDAAALWACIAAFGHHTKVVGLLVSYSLAQVLAAIPITPGGLGVVEATLSATLVGFGVPNGIAVLGVITWRLFEFWLPIPFGGLAYLSLNVGARQPARDDLRDAAMKGAEEREGLRSWAERHAIDVKERVPGGPRPATPPA
jgi:uncharacterized protein (TIRG00374 family)